MKLWPTDPDHNDSDRFVTTVIIALTIIGIVIAFLRWGS